MCRVIAPSVKTEISAYRMNHSIKETMTAFNVGHTTVSKIAPSSKIESRMRRAAGIRLHWAKVREQKAIRMALIADEIAELDNKIAELRQRKAELLKSVG